MKTLLLAMVMMATVIADNDCNVPVTVWCGDEVATLSPDGKVADGKLLDTHAFRVPVGEKIKIYTKEPCEEEPEEHVIFVPEQGVWDMPITGCEE